MSWNGFATVCPACAWTPRGEAVWSCPCGQELDVLAARGGCPSCRLVRSDLDCPRCRQTRSWSAWVKPKLTTADLVLTTIGVVLLVCAWSARALICLASDRAHVTAVAAGWKTTDPWGRPLASRVNRNTLLPLADVTVFSVGPNGIDEGGAGDDIEPWTRFTWQRMALSFAPSLGLAGLVAGFLTTLACRLALPARGPLMEGLIVLASSLPLGLFVVFTCRVGEAWWIEASAALGVRTGALGVTLSLLAGVGVLSAALRRLYLMPSPTSDAPDPRRGDA